MFIAANVTLLYYLDIDYFLTFLGFLNTCSIDVLTYTFYNMYIIIIVINIII